MKVTLIVNRETSIYRHFGKKTNILKKSTKFKSLRKITLNYKKKKLVNNVTLLFWKEINFLVRRDITLSN
jgi:hypothetical protein